MYTVTHAFGIKRFAEKTEETGRVLVQALEAIRHHRVEEEQRIAPDGNTLIGIMTAMFAPDKHDLVKVVAGIRRAAITFRQAEHIKIAGAGRWQWTRRRLR